jgi:hypothetical protein
MRTSIQELLDAEPFVPFVIVMNSGDRYEIRIAGMSFVERDVLTSYRFRSNRKDILRLAEITAVEVLDPDELS